MSNGEYQLCTCGHSSEAHRMHLDGLGRVTIADEPTGVCAIGFRGTHVVSYDRAGVEQRTTYATPNYNSCACRAFDPA